MQKIETVNIDTETRNYLDVLKQAEYYIASATVRGIRVIKFVSSPESTRSRVVKNSLRRAVRKCKSMGKIDFFVFGENFNNDDTVSSYLCDRAEYVKDDPDFCAGNENIVLVYINQKK